MKYLRQSTATTIVVGPFVAKADAVTPVTSLTTGSTLNGRAVSSGTGAAYAPGTFAHDANGYYLAALATGDVPAVGRFRLEFSDPATYLPVWEDFSVLSAAVYDSLFGATALSTYAGGAVASVTAPVVVGTNNDKTGYTLGSFAFAFNLNLNQTGITFRALDAVADSALTVGDALAAALCGAAGKQAVSGTGYAVKSPFTGTVIRTFTLDSASAPTTRS